MLSNKRPLLQKQGGGGGAAVRVLRRPPAEEGAEGSTGRTRMALRRLKEATNAKLFAAAEKGYLWDARNLVLLSHAEVNAVNSDGQSVLDVAKKSGNENLVRFLEGRGARSMEGRN